MKKSMAIVAGALLLALGLQAKDPAVGKPAPDFSVRDAQGREVSLKGLEGKYVVLEWFNFGCPFVKKHYGSGNMQALQKDMTKNGVVWVSVCSSAPGKQGHAPAKELEKEAKSKGSAAGHVVGDPDGSLGRLYGAKTTPHLFVINQEGTLIYKGAIDDRPGTDPKEIEGARNHVRAALAEAQAGRPVSVSDTPPYGCSVKYE